MHNLFMKAAIKEAYLGITSNHGGPFGSVIVKNNRIVGRGHNCVIKETDPTQHGEIVAIRDACKFLSTIDLSDCILYTTAEPCPMCLGAILWSGIKKVYYGCNKLDTENIGFRDNLFYEQIQKKELNINEFNRESCLELFKNYTSMDNKSLY